MEHINIGGKVYNLVPADAPVEEIRICDLEGHRYFLGPEAPDMMNWEEAIEWCKSLGDGYELPYREVLLMCFISKRARGEFVGDCYWSSTEFVDASDAWGQYFEDGYQYSSNKNFDFYVRAVRKVLI